MVTWSTTTSLRMDSFICKILVTVAFFCMALQHGCGRPLSARAEPVSGHARAKRCSCSSWDDKECVYFCHLDIIWVHTPSKLLPYGLGSRRRRSATRCACAVQADVACAAFCLDSSRGPSTEVRFPPQTSVKAKALASLRSVVRSNMAAATAKHLLSVNTNNMRHVRRPESRAGR